MSRKSIEDFKAVLQGGGVRPTMFQVELSFPPGVAEDTIEATQEAVFLLWLIFISSLQGLLTSLILTLSQQEPA